MMRAFTVTLPDDANFHNLYSLLVGQTSTANPQGYGAAQGGSNETGITGAIPTSGILSDKVGMLLLTFPSGNTENILLGDSNNSNTDVVISKSGSASSNLIGPFDKNIINLKDYWFANASAASNSEIGIIIEVN